MANDSNTQVAMGAMISMGARHAPPSFDQWRGLFLRSGDDWGPRLRAAEGMAQFGEAEGLRHLFQALESGTPEEQVGAWSLLPSLLGWPEWEWRSGGGFDHEEQYTEGRERLLAWWHEHSESMQWDAERACYRGK